MSLALDIHRLPGSGSALLLLLLAGAAPGSAAPCRERAPTATELADGARAGYRLATALERTGAEVAIVARVGSDQSKRGIRYTHAAISWRDHPQGRWHVVHLLNHCGRPTSELFDDGPVQFFLERPHSYDTLVVVPSPELQSRLASLLAAGAARRVHEPSYSAIAHPFRTEHQNSNQWLLEMLAVALDEGTTAPSRRTAQEHLRRSGYQPERVRLGFFQRVGARRMKNVKLDDHDARERRRGGYPFVSVRSVVDYLEALDRVTHREELTSP